MGGNQLIVDRKIRGLLRINNVFFILGILLSFNLWHNDRDFPIFPVHQAIVILAPPYDYILVGFLIGLLILLCIFQKRLLGGLCLILVLFLVVQDQMRWQPWVFMYSLFLIPIVFRKKYFGKSDLSYYQILIIGVYFWSAFHKFNWNFANTVFVNFAGNIFHLYLAKYSWLGFSIPFIELSMAIGLLFQKTRKIALSLAVISHLVILYWLSPLGKNTNQIIIPWNIAMIIFLFICFKNEKEKNLFQNFLKNPKFKASFLVPLVVILLPISYSWGFWDYYLSFNLYSGKGKNLLVTVNKRDFNELNIPSKTLYFETPKLPHQKVISINKWSLKVLNVPFSPDPRYFHFIGHYFHKQAPEKGAIHFLEGQGYFSLKNYESFSYSDFLKKYD